MTIIQPGVQQIVSVPPGAILEITTDANGTATIQRVADDGTGNNAAAPEYQAIGSSITCRFGPFPTPRRYAVLASGTPTTYQFANEDHPFYALKGNIEPFTGSKTLSPLDNGKIFRCEDASNVTITVPASLPKGFNVGFATWSTGTITVSAGTGATKRSPKTALSSQYAVGSIVVMKNTGGGAAEFVLGGDFA